MKPLVLKRRIVRSAITRLKDELTERLNREAAELQRNSQQYMLGQAYRSGYILPRTDQLVWTSDNTSETLTTTGGSFVGTVLSSSSSGTIVTLI